MKMSKGRILRSPIVAGSALVISFCVFLAARAGQNSSSGAQPKVDAKTAAAKRPPIRVIKDRYSSLSAVAVDGVNDEVIATDESLFQLLAYNRLDNTPASATLTEPKRIVSGSKTDIEFQCGLYVDPKSGDTYVVNNDTIDTLIIFSHNAKGNVPPDRALKTPHGTFGIAMDEDKKELFLTSQHANAVIVFSKMAANEEAPIRLIQGDHTGLTDPHGMAIDTKRKLMFVANYGSFHSKDPKAEVVRRGKTKANWPLETDVPGSGRILPPSITVHALNASGDAAPLRVITGPKTQLNWATAVALNVEPGELFVANDMGDSILVFRETDEGNVAPIRVIKGAKTGIKNPTGVFVDAKSSELWVANFGNHTLTVYPAAAAGDVAPLRTIRSAPTGTPALMIGNPGSVTYDSKRQEILVPN